MVEIGRYSVSYTKPWTEARIVVASTAPTRDAVFVEEVIAVTRVSTLVERGMNDKPATHRARLSFSRRILPMTPSRAKRS